MANSFSCSGTLVDLINRKFFPATVKVADGKISQIIRDKEPKSPNYILPGFIDAHVHIESSMLIPSEFARLAAPHGTVATISDPHEIANVLGLEGIRYMIQNGKEVPFHFYFGAPSCVPATEYETAGAKISAKEIEHLFEQDGLKYLSEMMNYPGVLHKDPEVLAKIAVAKKFGKPVDGHAPGLRGEEAKNYIAAGISTDHECYLYEEALEKIELGMKILIREGSAAKNYEALHPLIAQFPDKILFCSDDKHPHELVKGHINDLVKRSINQKKYELFDVLQIACLNPILHYKLDVGILRKGDSADFIVVNNLHDFSVLATYVKGIKIAENGKTLLSSIPATTPNQFHTEYKTEKDFVIVTKGDTLRVIQAEEGQLVTKSKNFPLTVLQKGVESDVLKLTVVNRYSNAKPAVAYIQNFSLNEGAIASCIAHDSHNIIAVGCSDEAICQAVNLLIQHKGGISAVSKKEEKVLPLPVAGIMTNEDGYLVAEKYSEIDRFAKSLGSTLEAPFMTLSFMALLVIPELKLSDKGLFDGKTFSFVPLTFSQ